MSSRSHGSAIRSASSRSEAKRSSAAGQPASSAPTRWARRTRLSTIAASANWPRWSPSEPGPSRSRSAPRMDPGGRAGRGRAVGLGQARRRTQSAFLDPGSGPRRAVPLEPGQRRRRGPAGDEEFGARVGGDCAHGRDPRLEKRQVHARRPPRRRRRGPGRAGRRCRSRAATAGAGRRPGSPPPPRASAAARCRRGGPGCRAGSRPARSPPRPPNTGCWRAPVARRPPRPRPEPGDRAAWRAGSIPSRGRRARPNRLPPTSSRRRSPNDASVGRTTDDRDVAGAGGDERASVVVGQRRARRPRPSA